jgi:hypothetical protein
MISRFEEARFGERVNSGHAMPLTMLGAQKDDYGRQLRLWAKMYAEDVTRLLTEYRWAMADRTNHTIRVESALRQLLYACEWASKASGAGDERAIEALELVIRASWAALL